MQQSVTYRHSMTASIFQMVLILGRAFTSFADGLASVILLGQPKSKAYYGR